MDSQDWRDLAEVFRAGELQMLGWYNPAAPVLGAALKAMAAKCDETAEATDDQS